MIEPGRYKHFKGGEYRVLFLATWADFGVKEGATVDIAGDSRGGPQLWASRDFGPVMILRAKWCGRREPNQYDGIVIYCDLGGVYARTANEFEERVEIGAPEAGLHGARFERIGP